MGGSPESLGFTLCGHLYEISQWSHSHLLPPLLRRALQLSGLVVFGIKQVDVIRGVADQHLLTVLAVAQRRHPARLVGQVSGNKANAHARRPAAHVVPWGWERGRRSWCRLGQSAIQSQSEVICSRPAFCPQSQNLVRFLCSIFLRILPTKLKVYFSSVSVLLLNSPQDYFVQSYIPVHVLPYYLFHHFSFIIVKFIPSTQTQTLYNDAARLHNLMIMWKRKLISLIHVWFNSWM